MTLIDFLQPRHDLRELDAQVADCRSHGIIGLVRVADGLCQRGQALDEHLRLLQLALGHFRNLACGVIHSAAIDLTGAHNFFLL